MFLDLLMQNRLVPAETSDRDYSVPSSSDDRLLRINEVARFLRLSVGSTYHLVSQGRLPVVRISSRCIRFSRKALVAWLDSLTQQPNEPEHAFSSKRSPNGIGPRRRLNRKIIEKETKE